MCRGKAATYAHLSKQKLAPCFSPFPRPFSHSPVLPYASLRFPTLSRTSFAFCLHFSRQSSLSPTSLRNLPDQFPNIRPKLSSI